MLESFSRVFIPSSVVLFVLGLLGGHFDGVATRILRGSTKPRSGIWPGFTRVRYAIRYAIFWQRNLRRSRGESRPNAGTAAPWEPPPYNRTTLSHINTWKRPSHNNAISYIFSPYTLTYPNPFFHCRFPTLPSRARRDDACRSCASSVRSYCLPL